MFDFKRIISKKAGSAEIGKAITAAEACQSEARARLEKLKGEDDAILRDGDDQAAGENEAAIAREDRAVRRLGLQIVELREKLAAAELRETQGKATRLVKAAKSASDRGVFLFDHYAEHAEAIAKILIELHAIDQMISKANAAALKIDVEGGVAFPNRRARKAPDVVDPGGPVVIGGKENPSEGSSYLIVDKHGRRIPRSPERTINRPRSVERGRELTELYKRVRLPAAKALDEDFWDESRLSQAVHEKIMAFVKKFAA